MTQMTQLRVLRLKHGVTLVEMGRAARVSNQQLSRLEVGVRPRTEQREERVSMAMDALIAARRASLDSLEHDYLAARGRLLEIVEVDMK